MKPPSNVKTPAQYIASLPADRAKTIATVRALVNKHIPRGYDECLVWGTIGWTIPLSRYPDTYNKQPICYVALSSQKNYCSLYLMGAFWSASQLEQLKAAFKAAGKKLDMGKCCVHFESPDDLPLEAIGKLISAISSEKWIEMYEQSRLMTKAGQSHMAKQGAQSASKAAAKRVEPSIGGKLPGMPGHRVFHCCCGCPGDCGMYHGRRRWRCGLHGGDPVSLLILRGNKVFRCSGRITRHLYEAQAAQLSTSR